MGRIFIILVVLTCLIYTGCGGNENEKTEPVSKADNSKVPEPAAPAGTSPAAESGISINPCDLINKEMAGNILKADVKDPVNEISKGMVPCKTCYYLTSAPIEKAGGTGSLRISVYDKEVMEREDSYMYKSPEKYFERNYDALKNSGGKIDDVANLGDKAFWQQGADELSVLSGNVYIKLQVKDMVKLSAPTITELNTKTSEYRLRVSEEIMRDTVLPKLADKK